MLFNKLTEPSIFIFILSNILVLRFKGRSEIFHGFKVHFSNDGTTYKITINKLCVDDAGKYTCKVNDIETSAHLTVERN